MIEQLQKKIEELEQRIEELEKAFPYKCSCGGILIPHHTAKSRYGHHLVGICSACGETDELWSDIPDTPEEV